MRYLLLVLTITLCNKSALSEDIYNGFNPVSYFVAPSNKLNLVRQSLLQHQVATIAGISGVGKTQLIRKYVSDNKKYYKIIWFFDVALDLNDQLLDLAKKINQKDELANLSENLLYVKHQVFTYLQERGNWLIVFDNIKIGDNAKIQEFINWDHNGHLVFCSQDGTDMPNVMLINNLDQKESAILSKQLLSQTNERFTSFLYKTSNGLPVLIEQGAQLLNNLNVLDVTEYQKILFSKQVNIQNNTKLALRMLTESASDLVRKIALINNQKFSKNFLKCILTTEKTLDSDIYQLLQYGLIKVIEADSNNPIFEVHDILSYQIQELNQKQNAIHIEDILHNLSRSMSDDIIKSHIYRNQPIERSNLEVILKNALQYKADIYLTLKLRLYLFHDYINTYNYYKSKQMVEWYEQQAMPSHSISVNGANKILLAKYMFYVGAYYSRRYTDYTQSLQNYEQAALMIENTDGEDLLKCNLHYNIALSYIGLGKHEEAIKHIKIVQTFLNSGNIKNQYVLYKYLSLSNLFLSQGNFHGALTNAELAVESFLSANVDPEDLLLTQSYLLEANILNCLHQYNKALEKVEILEKMYRVHIKSAKHGTLGKIFLQKARALFGQQYKKQAKEYIRKAINIFQLKENRLNIKIQ